MKFIVYPAFWLLRQRFVCKKKKKKKGFTLCIIMYEILKENLADCCCFNAMHSVKMD